MTWAEIEKACGGRSHGNASHFVKVAKISKKASARLKEIKQEDTEDIFSLRIEGKVRIYGIRDNAVLKILWFDPWHEYSNPKAVYPPTH